MKISVIIPNFNHANYLKKRIDSVINQSYQDIEVLLLDDCSTDNSKEIIESYRSHPKVSNIIYNVRNSGSTFKQWEKGILLAKGDWVWIAESDDYSEFSFLQTLVDLVNNNGNTGLAFCGSNWVDDKDLIGPDLSIYHKSFYKKGKDEVKSTLCRYCSIQNASSCIIRKDLALKSIPNLGKYRACGDWIFYVRILQHADLVFTSSKLNYFRWYHNNISNNARKDGLWITEGIDVLSTINYKYLEYSIGEFYRLIKFWILKINNSEINKKSVLFTKVLKIFFNNIFKTNISFIRKS